MNSYEKYLRLVFENSERVKEPFFCGNLFVGRLADNMIIKAKLFVSHRTANHSLNISIQRAGQLLDRQEFDMSVFGATGILLKRDSDVWEVLVMVDPNAVHDFVFRYVDLITKNEGGKRNECI